MLGQLTFLLKPQKHELMKRKAFPIIDGHQHAVPMKVEIPMSIRNAQLFDIEGPPGQQFMTQKFINWSRPISHPTFFINNERLEMMEAFNIEHAIILTLSQMYCNGFDEIRTYELMSFQNDFNCTLQENYPSKFTTGFVVQPRYRDQALKEIEKRSAEGFDFLCLPTHYERPDGTYVSCTDENCQAIFKQAEEFGLAIQFHPYDYEKVMKNLIDVDSFWAGHVLGLQYLTAHLHYQLTCKNLHTKFKDVNFAFSHGNILATATMGRKTQAFDGRRDLFPEVSGRPADALFAPNLFSDLITHDPELILYLKAKGCLGNYFEGTDLPYPLGQGVWYVEGREKEYPGFMLDVAEQKGYITDIENRMISCRTTPRWLYGDNTAAHLVLRNRIEGK